jgi:hypothetical protein
MKNIEYNFMQIVDLTHDEKVDMYMKCSKKELIEMLINCNDILSQNYNYNYSFNPMNKGIDVTKCPKCGSETKPSIYAYTLAECTKCGHHITEFNH